MKIPKHIAFLDKFFIKNNLKKRIINLETKTGKTSSIYIKSKENKKTIIFVHGFGNDKYYPFIELFTILLKNGFSIISIDLPGHGSGNSSFFTLESSQEALSKTIQYLKNNLKIKKNNIVMLGHSTGGFFCLSESINNSCRAIILISAPYEINLKPKILLEPVSFLSPNIIRQLKYYSLFWLIPSFTFFNHKRYPLNTQTTSKINYFAEKMKKASLLNSLKKSSLPCLQIHSKLDLIIPFSQAEKIKENYNGKIDSLNLIFSSHFTTIFSKKTANSIISWLNTLE